MDDLYTPSRPYTRSEERVKRERREEGVRPSHNVGKKKEMK